MCKVIDQCLIFLNVFFSGQYLMLVLPLALGQSNDEDEKLSRFSDKFFCSGILLSI